LPFGLNLFHGTARFGISPLPEGPLSYPLSGALHYLSFPVYLYQEGEGPFATEIEHATGFCLTQHSLAEASTNGFRLQSNYQLARGDELVNLYSSMGTNSQDNLLSGRFNFSFLQGFAPEFGLANNQPFFNIHYKSDLGNFFTGIENGKTGPSYIAGNYGTFSFLRGTFGYYAGSREENGKLSPVGGITWSISDKAFISIEYGTPTGALDAALLPGLGGIRQPGTSTVIYRGEAGVVIRIPF
jgi:hypothetical protein